MHSFHRRPGRSTLTGVVHVNEHGGEELEVLHAARAQRHQEVERRDHSQGGRTHRHHLFCRELALRLPALEHDFGRREDEVFNQFLETRKQENWKQKWTDMHHTEPIAFHSTNA